jgi:hypothetical protein
MPSTAGNYEIIIKGSVAESVGGKAVDNVFHYVAQGPGTTQPSPTTLLTWFLANVWSVAALALHPGWVGVASSCRLMDNPLNAAVAGATPANGAHAAGDRLPLFNAVVIQKKTGIRGKSYRGSNHFGPISEADTTLDQLTGAGLTLWQNLQAAMALTMAAAGGAQAVSPAVFSPTLSPKPVTIPTLVNTQVTSTLLNLTIGTMRKRKERTAN